MATKTMTRRKFLTIALALIATSCGDSYSERRNRWFERTGKDRPEPGDGKGGDDDCCKEKK